MAIIRRNFSSGGTAAWLVTTMGDDAKYKKAIDLITGLCIICNAAGGYSSAG